MKSPLLELRYQRGITVQQLSVESSISTQTIVSIENGYRDTITLKVLRKIADYFNIDPIPFLEQYETFYKSLQQNEA